MRTFDVHARARRAPVLAFALAVALTVPATVSGASPTVERIISNHDVHGQHFDADPNCGPYTMGTTEIVTRNEHIVLVDHGDRFHFTYNAAFEILVVPDDPAVPSHSRRGTEVLSFHLLKDGSEIFHQSFHDFGPAAWMPFAKIRINVTFVVRDGQVVVDHAVVHDEPPPGC